MSPQTQNSFAAYYGEDFKASAGLVTPLNEIDPVYELPQIEQAACELAKKSLIDKKIVSSAADIIVRNFIITDESGINTGVISDGDIRNTTAQRAALGRMTQDSADLTADDLKSILVSGMTIDTQKAVAIYGFEDHTPEPDRDLVALRFKRGNSDTLGFFPVQHCYVGDAPHGGIFGEYKPIFENGKIVEVVFVPFIMLWQTDEKIDIEACVQTATDKMIVVKGVIAEQIGVNISPTSSKKRR